MQISADERDAFGVALNEATLHGVELDVQQRVAAVTLEVLTLPESGPAPPDARIQLILRPVGRVTASLRDGSWNDPKARVVPFRVEDLTAVVDSVAGLNIYGWSFIDVHQEKIAKWGDRLSLDWQAGPDGLSHSLCLFQESRQHFDLLVWFDELRVFDPAYQEISISEFLASGRRWWEAFRSHDPRTRGRGLASLRRSDA
jgi:hypothetical protein